MRKRSSWCSHPDALSIINADRFYTSAARNRSIDADLFFLVTTEMFAHAIIGVATSLVTARHNDYQHDPGKSDQDVPHIHIIPTSNGKRRSRPTMPLSRCS